MLVETITEAILLGLITILLLISIPFLVNDLNTNVRHMVNLGAILKERWRDYKFMLFGIILCTLLIGLFIGIIIGTLI